MDSPCPKQGYNFMGTQGKLWKKVFKTVNVGAGLNKNEMEIRKASQELSWAII